MRAVIDALPQLVWTARPDGSIDFCNRQWIERTGVSTAKVQRIGFRAVLHADDVERCVSAWDGAVETGEPFEVEARIKQADGTDRWHLGRASAARDEQGRVVKWFGTYTDIDAQKRSEHAVEILARAGMILTSSLDYEETLSNLTRFIMPALADGCVIGLNEGDAVRTVAIAHADPVKEEAIRDMARRYPFADQAPHGPPHVQRSGEAELVPPLTEDAVRMIASDEESARQLLSLGTVSGMVVPMTVHGRTLGVISFLSDQSGRRYTEADLLVAGEIGRRAAVAVEHAQVFNLARMERQRVEAANRARDEFLAVVTHELRTPLTAILGWTRLLQRGTLDESRRQQAVSSIERSANTQKRLIDDLLDVSRLIAGKLRLNVTLIPLVPVIEAALDTVRPAADAKGIYLAPLSACAGAQPVLGDADRLLQVIWNLLANAVKFTPQGGRIATRLRRDGPCMEIAVEDSGRGIPPDLAVHLFDTFWQADMSPTRATGGLGLGLAIVRRVVELHGGSVSVRSSGVDQGATFLVRLPIPSAQG